MTSIETKRTKDWMIDLAHLLDRPRVGRGDQLTIDEVLELPARSPLWVAVDLKANNATMVELRRLLSWLVGFPGAGWQQRWQASGADTGLDWLGTLPDHRPFTQGGPRGADAGLVVASAGTGGAAQLRRAAGLPPARPAGPLPLSA
ncbi:hypothetical protein AB0F91_46990 [Amycolatopsis sp. NPDC023774]|uniref:hypothetical protein n=1 Tax=Amycolatopsis sp. NPDC023774 TaxID=3155015 RepID=UPI003401CCBF